MSRRARTYAEPTQAKRISLLPLGPEADVEDDSQMCECDITPTAGELETGRCSCCGRAIYPQWGEE